MRKLLGRLATLTTPLVAMAMVSSSPQREPQVADQRVQKGDLAADFLEFCGLECKVLAEGEAGISGNAAIDAFFAATLNFQAQALSLEAEVRAELVSIATAAGVKGAAKMELDELVAEIRGQVRGGFGGVIEGDLRLMVTPPKCEVSASASVQAAAKCDAEVDPGSASVECKGSCEAEASASAKCDGKAELKCKGTAPAFNCDGTCTGTCELEAGGSCEGTCEGKCNMDGSAACDGECLGDTDEGGNCTGECKVRSGGSCTGSCEGNCELAAGGTCDGACKGECEYTAPSGGCEAGATAKCEAKGSASVECNGKCDGEVTPPKVSAECEASAKAEAKFAAECHPPAVEIKYDLTAEGQAMFEAGGSAQAAFEGRIQAIGKAYANLVAKGAKLEAVAAAGPALIDAANGAVLGASQKLLKSRNARAAAGAYCAGKQFGVALDMLATASDSFVATGEAVGQVTAMFAGG